MHKFIIALSLIIIPNIAHAETNKIFGKWFRGDGGAKVDIYECGNNVCAKNFWIKSDIKDEKIGDVLVMSLKPDGTNQLSGKASDPQRNLSYNIKINHSTNVMTTKGCVFGGIICKKVSWKKL